MEALASVTLRSNGERFYVDVLITEAAHDYGLAQVKARRSVRLGDGMGSAEGADTIANMIAVAARELGNQVRIAWADAKLF